MNISDLAAGPLRLCTRVEGQVQLHVRFASGVITEAVRAGGGGFGLQGSVPGDSVQALCLLERFIW